jgi:hypothetical protein
MSASAAEGSYFSRFLMKFIEIIAAGLATAVSGYLIAHLSGALPSSPASTPTAAVDQVTPSISMRSSLPLQPNQEVNAPPAAQSEQSTADVKKAEASRKHVESATAAESSNQRKPLLARVRAALANVDAKRTDPLEVASRPADVARPSPAMAQPQPITAPPAITNPPITAAVPSPLIPGEVRSAASHDTPIDRNPLPKVEVTSRPVAEPPAPSTEMSPLEQRLRQDPLIGTVDPPRPPMPVAQ